MRKQKLYFVGDKNATKTRQYVAVSNVRAEAERMAAEFGAGYDVIVRAVPIDNETGGK